MARRDRSQHATYCRAETARAFRVRRLVQDRRHVRPDALERPARDSRGFAVVRARRPRDRRGGDGAARDARRLLRGRRASRRSPLPPSFPSTPSVSPPVAHLAAQRFFPRTNHARLSRGVRRGGGAVAAAVCLGVRRYRRRGGSTATRSCHHNKGASRSSAAQATARRNSPHVTSSPLPGATRRVEHVQRRWCERVAQKPRFREPFSEIAETRPRDDPELPDATRASAPRRPAFRTARPTRAPRGRSAMHHVVLDAFLASQLANADSRRRPSAPIR